MKNRIILFVIILLGCVSALNAQNREYSAEIDTNYIMIGDQIHFRMKVKAEPGVKVAFPQLKDTIAQGIEIISGPVRDSIMEKDGRVLVQESYVITSFDSGVFVIPPMPIEIQQESYNNTLRTVTLDREYFRGRSAERELRYCDAFGCSVDICRDITLLVMDIVGDRGDSSGCLDYQSSEIP